MDIFDEDDDNHDCSMAMESSILDMQNKLAKRMVEMQNTMNKQFKELNRSLNLANRHIEALNDKKKTKELKCNFPCKTEEELAEIDKKIAASPAAYLPIFEGKLMPEGIVKNLEKIISRDLALQINFRGTAKMKPFDKYIHLNKVMYEATTTIDRNFSDYQRNMRTAFAKIKNRAYKSNSIKRQNLKKAKASIKNESDN
ncbi:uncharacterized protein LOC117570851 [Drosophila albomicans]|uniref:Uncharacterized protein LOC117570851 n=1 Tax=Drosophila albomicans TaxID=7291 RepID=A0A6P8YRS2_DROAB|nr:uncharacterized protein LOC117570851 [Drosophila albomicans]